MDVDPALSIPEHSAGRSAQLLSAFSTGTFRGLYIGNGIVSDADIEAAATCHVRDLRLGWIHVTRSFSGREAERLVLEATSEAFAHLVHVTESTAHHCSVDDEALRGLLGPHRCGS